MSINERIKNIRKDNNLSQIDFSRVLNIKQATLSQIENDVIAPSLDIIKKIIGNYNISYEWLIDGVGTMLKEEKNTYIYNSVVNENSIENKITNNGLINYTIEKIKDLETKLNNEKKILEILQNRHKPDIIIK